MSKLTERIEERIRSLNTSATEVSIAAGLNPNAIGDILRGKTKSPRADSLYAIANILQCSPDYLLGKDAKEGRPTEAANILAAIQISTEELNLITYFRAIKSKDNADAALGKIRKLLEEMMVTSSS